MLTNTTITLPDPSQRQKRLYLALIGFGIVCLLLSLFFFIKGLSAGNTFSPLGQANQDQQASVQEEKTVPNPLNGVLVTPSEAISWEQRYPVAVMIENLNITRPQTGLSRADIVYEALSEGEITRFMALYLSENSDLGPIRSVRLPYLHWALEYDAAVAHVGGSTEALEQIRPLGSKDLDQAFIGEPTYQRLSNRGLSLEHTMFSSALKLWDKALSLGYQGVPAFDSWKFKDDASVESRPRTQQISLRFTGNRDYVVGWVYNPKTNDYERSNGGFLHLDKATEEAIRAKVVIVQSMKTSFEEVSPGQIGRKMETVGSGEVRIFQDGVSILGTWEKKSPTARTKFFAANGDEISLNRGKIWVEVNPTDSPLEYN